MANPPDVMRSVAALAQEIRKRITGANHYIIGVDGFMSTGKTEISKKLAWELGASLVAFDDYLPNGDGASYLDALRKDDLAKRLEDEVHKSPVTVIEGICLLEVLEYFGLQPKMLVYVKRISNSGTWHDEIHSENFQEGHDGWHWLEVSAFKYHASHSPNTKADFVFERIED